MQEKLIPVYKQLKKEGTILVLDTGYSDDMSLEKHKDLIEIADYYTPNIDETEKLTGTREYKEALKILGEYFEKPVVKLGKLGCAGYDKDYFVVDNVAAAVSKGEVLGFVPKTYLRDKRYFASWRISLISFRFYLLFLISYLPYSPSTNTSLMASRYPYPYTSSGSR